MQQERRKNWKEELGEEARQRAKLRDDLLVQKELISKQIKACGTNFAKYDELKQKQREVMAQLATL